MRLRSAIRALSPVSRWLLLSTFFISTALFMLNPYLLIGLASTTSLGVGAVSACLLIAMIVGNVAGLLLSTRASQAPQRWLSFCCLGLAIAPLGLALSRHIGSQAATLFLMTVAMIVLRGSFAVFFTLSKSVHLSGSGTSVSASTVFTFVSGTFAIGAALGPVLAVQLIESSGYGALFALGSGLFFVATVLIRCSPRPGRPTVSVSVSSSLRECARQLPVNRPLSFLLAAAFLLHVLLAQVFSYLPLVLTADHPNGVAVTATFFTSHAVLMVVLPVVVVALLQTRVSTPITRFAFGTVLIAAALSVLGVRSDSWLWFSAAVVAISLGELLAVSNSMEILQQSSGRDQLLVGNVAIYTFVCSGLGLGVGQLAGTVLYEVVPRWASAAVWVILGGLSATLVHHGGR